MSILKIAKWVIQFYEKKSAEISDPSLNMSNI